jgi:hypothetical protein
MWLSGANDKGDPVLRMLCPRPVDPSAGQRDDANIGVRDHAEKMLACVFRKREDAVCMPDGIPDQLLSVESEPAVK